MSGIGGWYWWVIPDVGGRGGGVVLVYNTGMITHSCIAHTSLIQG